MNKNEGQNVSFNGLLTSFLEYLQFERHYKQLTLGEYKRKLTKISSFMKRSEIAFYSPEVGLKYYEHYVTKNPLQITTKKALLTMVNRLNNFYLGSEYKICNITKFIDPLPQDFEQALDKFKANCSEKGNKDNTVKDKDRFLRSFLKNCIIQGCDSLFVLQPNQVMKACLKVTDKDSWAVIRTFLRFLQSTGKVKSDMSLLVPHYKRPIKVPVTYTTEEISSLEKAINRTTNIGKRDYAMLLLATRLGIRSGDIVNLKFDNIDFKSSTLSFVQKKTNKPLRLPLLPEIVEALQDYLNNGRHKTPDSRIFISHKAPYEGISSSALYHVSTKYFHLAKINISGKKHGPQTFRCSVATSMVNDSVPYAYSCLCGQ